MILTKCILANFYLFQRIVTNKSHSYETAANDRKYKNDYVFKTKILSMNRVKSEKTNGREKKTVTLTFIIQRPNSIRLMMSMNRKLKPKLTSMNLIRIPKSLQVTVDPTHRNI